MALLWLWAVGLRSVEGFDLLAGEPGQVAGASAVQTGPAARARSVLGLLGKPQRLVADDAFGIGAGEHSVEDAEAEVLSEVRVEADLHEVAVPDPVEHGPGGGPRRGARRRCRGAASAASTW